MRLPGLHSIHWKVFVFHLAVLILPLAYISYKVRTSIETSYLHSTEEGMIDTAAAVSELYARLYGQYGADSEKVAAEFSQVFSNLNETYEIKARLFGFTRAEVDSRQAESEATKKQLADETKKNLDLVKEKNTEHDQMVAWKNTDRARNWIRRISESTSTARCRFSWMVRPSAR